LEWVNMKVADINNRDFPEDYDETVKLIEAHKTYKVSEKKEQNEKRLDNETLFNNIQTRLRTNKRKLFAAPSGLTVEDVDAAWEQLGVAEKDRTKALRDHLLKQKDKLRKDFADKANDFYNYVGDLKADVTREHPGDLQEQLNAIKNLEAQVDADGRAAELQDLYKKLEDLGLADENPHTDYTLDELLLLLDSVKNAIKKKKQFLQGQLSSSGQSNITEDTLNEIRETFKHFDKDGSNTLDKLEFKAALQVLGLTYSEEEFNRLWNELTNGKDRIDMDTFIKWMIKLLEDTDDANQIKQSFKILANDKASVMPSDLKVSPLNGDDINYLTGRMPGSNDNYDYNTYTDSCFA